MKKITKSVIKLSELPIRLQKNEIFKGHKLHTYAEFHIDESEKDELSLWLIENYPTIKMKISFLIHIDSDEEIDYPVDKIDYPVDKIKQQCYNEEDMINFLKSVFGMEDFDYEKALEQFKNK